MGRKLTPEDRDIWDKVARTVSPATPRKAERIAVTAASIQSALKAPPKFVKPPKPVPSAPAPSRQGPARTAQGAPDPLEPRRHRRIARERDPIEATLDALCRELDCQPGDLLAWEPGPAETPDEADTDDGA